MVIRTGRQAACFVCAVLVASLLMPVASHGAESGGPTIDDGRYAGAISLFGQIELGDSAIPIRPHGPATMVIEGGAARGEWSWQSLVDSTTDIGRFHGAVKGDGTFSGSGGARTNDYGFEGELELSLCLDVAGANSCDIAEEIGGSVEANVLRYFDPEIETVLAQRFGTGGAFDTTLITCSQLIAEYIYKTPSPDKPWTAQVVLARGASDAVRDRIEALHERMTQLRAGVEELSAADGEPIPMTVLLEDIWEVVRESAEISAQLSAAGCARDTEYLEWASLLVLDGLGALQVGAAQAVRTLQEWDEDVSLELSLWRRATTLVVASGLASQSAGQELLDDVRATARDLARSDDPIAATWGYEFLSSMGWEP